MNKNNKTKNKTLPRKKRVLSTKRFPQAYKDIVTLENVNGISPSKYKKRKAR